MRPRPPAVAGAARRWAVLVVVLACFLPAAIDVTILNIAVPAIAESTRASGRELLWIVDVYSLPMIGLVLVTGPLGDRIGHRRLLLMGLVVFGVVSGLASQAGTPAMLIAGRAGLAVGAAMVIPATLAIIRQTFDDPREFAFAVGAWSAVAAGASALGPVLGGVLLHHFRWGSGLPGQRAGRAPPRARGDRPAHRPRRRGAPTVGGDLAGAGHGGIDGPGLRRDRGDARGLDADRDHRPRGARAVRRGFELTLVQYLQFALQFSALDAALRLLPMPVAALAASLLMGSVAVRIGPRTGIAAGLGLAAVGYAVIAASTAPFDGTLLAVGLGLAGAGHGAVQTVASGLVMTGAPVEEAGGAAAIESVSFEVGAGIGVAVIGSVTALCYRWFLVLPDTAGRADVSGAADSIARATTVATDLGGDVGRAVAAAAQQPSSTASG